MARRQRRTFSAEFKHDAASLIFEHGYGFAEGCRAVDVHENTLRSWVQQLESECGGITSKSKGVITPSTGSPLLLEPLGCKNATVTLLE